MLSIAPAPRSPALLSVVGTASLVLLVASLGLGGHHEPSTVLEGAALEGAVLEGAVLEGAGAETVLPAAGRMLHATALMPDPTFAGSHILLIHHNAASDHDGGTVGLMLEQERFDEGEGIFSSRCGPVGQGSVVALFKTGAPVENAQRVDDTWSISAPSDAIEAVREQKLDELILCVGYAGWGPGQLEGELAEGVWTVSR